MAAMSNANEDQADEYFRLNFCLQNLKGISIFQKKF